MPQPLNLQRNSEVFFSTVNLYDGDAFTDMTPSNTWKVEILAGYAASQSAATQDINSLESGLSPDRSSRRFKTSLNPVDWNFQTYIRPTGIQDDNDHSTSAVMPVCDWYLWQALVSNTNVYDSGGGDPNSAWQIGGKYDTEKRTASGTVAAHNSNYAVAPEYNMYIKMENVIYQVKKATVNQAAVDAAIDGIATTTWTGFGTELVELTGTTRSQAVSVFGGIINDCDNPIAANSNSTSMTRAASYHPWTTWNVNSSLTTPSFIKNRLSSLVVKHQTAGGAANTYTFPLTAVSFTYNNNISYLTPEELSIVNVPIGQFAGAREITGSFTAYLRGANGDSGQLFRDLAADTRPAPLKAANANLIIGGTTAPYVAFNMPSVVFDIPTHGIEDIITVTVNFKAQEGDCGGNGGEVEIFAKKS